ncbi:MAG: hypothetical protein RL661_202 [Pseudomonadota bacterium]
MTGLVIAGVLIVYLFIASRLAFDEFDWTELEGCDEGRNREVDERNRGSDPAVLEKDQ